MTIFVTKQAAAYAGVAPSTWRAYVSKGRAPAADGHHDARTPYWEQATLDEWLLNRPGQGFRSDAYVGAMVERARQWNTVEEAVTAYLAAGPADLTGFDWYTAWWGSKGPKWPELHRDALFKWMRTHVDSAVLRLADDTGRDYTDPDVLADVDLDAAWALANAEHIRVLATEEKAKRKAGARINPEAPGNDDPTEQEDRVLALLSRFLRSLAS